MIRRPVSNLFAEVSILGLFISTLLLNSEIIPLPWGITFFVFFTILFIVSLMGIRPTAL